MSSTKELYDEFDSTRYLAQFYSGAVVSDDEAVNFRAMRTWLTEQGKTFDRTLEVGCGPTIHHALPLVGFVKELVLCDYSAENRNAVQRWLSRDPDAHDWRAYIRGYLDVTGLPSGEQEILAQEEAVRSMVKSVVHCDLLRDPPLEDQATYDLVTCYYTAECAAATREHWLAVMGRLLSLVRPGGSLVTTAIRSATWYDVLGKRFPLASVNEDDFIALLPQHGFQLANAQIEPVRVHGWEEEGFDSIVLVRAVRD